MPTYKVGIMSDTKWVNAPSPEAAALFYGLHTHGNATLMAVVYECDGVEYDGGGIMPWAEFSPLAQIVDYAAVEQRLEEKLQAIKEQMTECEFVQARGQQP